MDLVPSHLIRQQFARAMSDMYQKEVPAYGTLLDIVREVNEKSIKENPALLDQLGLTKERISEERHGAIRLGKPEELTTIAKLFAIVGMYPVGYYDLSIAGLPVHSTAFRPIDKKELDKNPFRIFTSLLRLELLEEPVKTQAEAVIASREIFNESHYKFINFYEKQGGLTPEQVPSFIKSLVYVFKWHRYARISREFYEKLLGINSLVADVIGFQGPHINHLTPNTLNIDQVHQTMHELGMKTIPVIQGPPERLANILLRQTSFRALDEEILFTDDDQNAALGTHRARFGEIEKRGVALTRKGRALYDELLAKTEIEAKHFKKEDYARHYPLVLNRYFADFPDDWEVLRKEELAYFTYHRTEKNGNPSKNDLETLIKEGYVVAKGIVYEDFLPVSAAGIFKSNLDEDSGEMTVQSSNKAAFETALGQKLHDPFTLYEEIQAHSLDRVFSN